MVLWFSRATPEELGKRIGFGRGKLDATRTEERAFAKASLRRPPWILDEEDGVRFGILNVDGD